MRKRLLAVTLLAALLVPLSLPAVASAALRPQRSDYGPSAVRPLESPDVGNDIGQAKPIPASPFAGTLNAAGGDIDDVYRIHLTPGQMLTVTLDSSSPDAEMFVDLWAPNTVTVNSGSDPLAWDDMGGSEDSRYPATLFFVAGSDTDYFLDVWGFGGAYTISYTIESAPVDLNRIEGGTRYQTAIKVSQAGWGNGSATNIVLATGQNFADALAASPLAGTYDCPILLTPTASLPSEVLTEIHRLRGSAEATVHVVGSAAAVSTSVEDQLTDAGLEVNRIEGPTRYSTAAAIAMHVKQHEIAMGRTPNPEVFVVNGMNYPDALAVAPYAYREKMPILLVQPWSAPPVTHQVLGDYGATKAFVAGWTPAVSEAVYNGLPVADKQRLYGANRYSTMKAVVDYACDPHGDGTGADAWVTDKTRVGIATGRNFPDALGGGPLFGKWGAVMLLTEPDDLVPEADDYILDNAETLETVRVLGSYNAVSDLIFGYVLFSFGS